VRQASKAVGHDDGRDCRRFEQTLPRSLGHRGELTAILSHEVNGVASLTRSPSSSVLLDSASATSTEAMDEEVG